MCSQFEIHLPEKIVAVRDAPERCGRFRPRTAQFLLRSSTDYGLTLDAPYSPASGCMEGILDLSLEPAVKVMFKLQWGVRLTCGPRNLTDALTVSHALVESGQILCSLWVPY